MQVLNATHEDVHVYVLLDDQRILKSRALDNKHCAEIHAEQVIELKLEPAFLLNVLHYTVAEDV